jgi:uncharacterized metal-binding protein
MYKSRVTDLNDAVADFAGEYQYPGSGITSVDKHGNSIRVLVTDQSVAETLPISYQGVNVAVFLDKGKAGMRLLLRDRNGTVIGGTR